MSLCSRWHTRSPGDYNGDNGDNDEEDENYDNDGYKGDNVNYGEKDDNDGSDNPRARNDAATITNGVPGHNYLRCMYTNADGIVNKIEEMKDRVNDYKPDIFAIVETHCQQNEESSKYCPKISLFPGKFESTEQPVGQPVQGAAPSGP